jgi:hypothetical protein
MSISFKEPLLFLFFSSLSHAHSAPKEQRKKGSFLRDVAHALICTSVRPQRVFACDVFWLSIRARLFAQESQDTLVPRPDQIAHGLHIGGITGEVQTTEFPAIFNRRQHRVMIESLI